MNARDRLFAVFVFVALAAATAIAAPLGSEFTYQGQLILDGNPVDGVASLRFSLWDAVGSGNPPTGGNQIGASQLLGNVPVSSGLFTVQLNGSGQFGASAFSGDARWLQVEVCTEPGCSSSTVLGPRQPITAAPYARFATAPWSKDGNNLSYGGWVGIGTTSPQGPLEVRSGTSSYVRIDEVYGDIHANGGTDGALGIYNDDQVLATGRTEIIGRGVPRLAVMNTGNVGIGTTAPAQRLHVVGPRLRLENAGKVLDLRADGGAIDLESTTSKLFLHSSGPGGNNHIVMQPFGSEGNVGIGTENPTTKLEVAGTTRTTVLEVTGADLAERFPSSAKLEPGLVVAIDPDAPGSLCLAKGAYNRRVAGIVSGANDFAAGAILGNLQDSDDAPPVALSGRVYAWCDASASAIEPGDLLTTSEVPGHAMRAADLTQARGAILGKAMTGLAAGRGLVLVLVSLQ